MCSSKATGVSACYRLIFCISCFLFLLHKFLPSLFALLVSSSPLIACTFLLLGILLILGESNVPQNEKEDDDTSQAISKIHLRLENRGGFKSKAHAGSSRRALRRLKVKTVVLGDRKVDANGVTRVDSASVDSNSCSEDDECGKNKKNNEKKNAVKEGKRSATKLEDCSDSSSTSSSSSSASSSSDIKSEDEEKRNSKVANVASALNEIDRFFESGHNNAGGVQHEVEEDDDDEDEDDDDDDDDTQEEKEDVSKVAVKFTADDQRVLVELGRSELERNRRLEHILTWRRARQVREKNQIDLDDGNAEQSQGLLSSIYVPRRNPFDLHEDSDDPGSAPSMLQPRRNLFDLPYHQEAAGDNNSSNWDFVSPRAASVFRRHETFTVGGSFFSDFRQDKRPSRFKPYFGAEINKQFSETADSKTGSTSKYQHQTTECDTEHNPEHDSSESVDAERLEKRMNKNKDQTTKNLKDQTSQGSVSNSSTSSIERAPEMAHQDRELSSSSPSETTAVDESADNAADDGRPNLLSQRLDRRAAEKRDNRQPQASSSGFSWFASPSLSSVDEIEAGSKEVSVIKEFDVIGDELRRVREDFGRPGLKVVSSTSSIRRQLLRSNSSFIEVESEEES